MLRFLRRINWARIAQWLVIAGDPLAATVAHDDD
jgi:hypothetical protein